MTDTDNKNEGQAKIITKEEIKELADFIGGDEDERREMEAFLMWVVGNDE